MDTRANPFDRLPPDILQYELPKYLSGDDMVALSQTSRSAHALFQPLLYDKGSLPLLKQALDHAARGEWDDVDTLLQQTPELLTYRGTIQHHGRYKLVNRTIWQIALMNDEGENVDVMFQRHFAQLPNGLEEMARQVQEVFPDGKMIKYDGWNLEKALDLFNSVLGAIKRDKTIDENNLNKMNDDTKQALQAFYDYVTPKPSDAFTKGLLFDIRLFQTVLQKYGQKFDELNWNQRVFYGVKLWDYLVRLLPTGYLRPLCQGLYSIVDHNAPLSVNGCKLRTGAGIGNGAAVLPLDSDTRFVFGQDFISIFGFGERGCRRMDGETRSTWAWKTYLMLSKNNKQKEFHAALAATLTPTLGRS
ncbi:MAG: hypothetical protein A3E83_07190 [Gammaproteobacteria bacterium RIFCSPHIGHO2_12_FULL_41_20]|nr:MAG: hypothetical protein A3E83_07190 [Gammaproteobacteria bacterium RIFCSPHIGHO2_12_FULL_41_20]